MQRPATQSQPVVISLRSYGPIPRIPEKQNGLLLQQEVSLHLSRACRGKLNHGFRFSFLKKRTLENKEDHRFRTELCCELVLGGQGAVIVKKDLRSPRRRDSSAGKKRIPALADLDDSSDGRPTSDAAHVSTPQTSTWSRKLPPPPPPPPLLLLLGTRSTIWSVRATQSCGEHGLEQKCICTGNIHRAGGGAGLGAGLERQLRPFPARARVALA